MNITWSKCNMTVLILMPMLPESAVTIRSESKSYTAGSQWMRSSRSKNRCHKKTRLLRGDRCSLVIIKAVPGRSDGWVIGWCYQIALGHDHQENVSATDPASSMDEGSEECRCWLCWLDHRGYKRQQQTTRKRKGTHTGWFWKRVSEY